MDDALDPVDGQLPLFPRAILLRRENLHVLADFAGQFERPCCLCAPILGQELARRKKNVTILDVDDRFSAVPGFPHWDLNRPQHLSAELIEFSFAC